MASDSPLGKGSPKAARAGGSALKAGGVTVKVNTIIVPSVNDGHVEEVARGMAELKVDLLNCMPMYPNAHTPFADIPDADWERFYQVNVMSGVRLSRACLPGMIRRNWGRIVFISSESGVQIPEEMIHYGMTKAAELALVNGIARLTKGTGVTVNAVLPGPTASEGVTDFVETLASGAGQTSGEFEKEFFRSVRPTSLLQRFAAVDEVASMVAYLCSPLASATNGAAMRVDGGVVRGT